MYFTVENTIFTLWYQILKVHV